MAYRLKAKESVPDGIRRVVIEEIDCALGELYKHGSAEQDEAIHSARKSIKKIRGVLRLVRPELGSAYRRENAELRSAGRGLSELRDSRALVETVGHLTTKYAGELKPGALDRLRDGLHDNKRRKEEQLNPLRAMQTAAQGLEALRGRVPDWPLETDGFKAIEPGLKRSYRDGRRALRAAVADPNAVCFHQWRKRTKDHWYHARLLEKLWPEEMTGRANSAHQVERALGEDHNLYVLRCEFEAFPERFGDEEQIGLFLALAGREQSELRATAIGEGQRLYQSPPREIIAHFRGLWELWHDPSAAAPKRKAHASRPPHKRVAVA